jgi:hypothetical protein
MDQSQSACENSNPLFIAQLQGRGAAKAANGKKGKASADDYVLEHTSP